MKKTPDKISYTAAECMGKLAALFPNEEYALLGQLRNGTGFSRDPRTADAFAMSLWPSRGLNIIGFEVKVSRTDWIRELRRPEKAEDIAQYCDQWYLVVGDASIMQPGELPPTWGLIIPDPKKGLKISVVAPQLKKPKPIDKVMLAGILRNISSRMISKDVLESEFSDRFQAGKDWAKSSLETSERQMKEIRDGIAAFEKASGVRLSSWNSESENKDIGEAVRAVLTGKNKRAKRELVKLRDTAHNIAKFIDGEIEPYQI